MRLARPAEAVARRAHALELLEQRLTNAPARALAAGRARADAAAGRLRHAVAIARARIAARIDAAALRLQALDPQQVLSRGYALLADRDGRPVTSIAALAVGDTVSARLADGTAELTVRSRDRRSASR